MTIGHLSCRFFGVRFSCVKGGELLQHALACEAVVGSIDRALPAIERADFDAA